jgi:hypothetical protein
MATVTAPERPAPERWAVAAVLGFLDGEADHRAAIARHLRAIDDVDRQQQIIEAIKAIRDLTTAHFPAA